MVTIAASRRVRRTPFSSGVEAAGVKVGQTPSETAQLMRDILGR